MAKDIKLSQLCNGFEKAVIIDAGREMVLVIKNNKGNIYPKEYFEKLANLIAGTGIESFE